MTQEEKSLNATIKAQKDAAIMAAKKEARKQALNTSQYIRSSATVKDLLKDADVIYKWLIQDLK